MEAVLQCALTTLNLWDAKSESGQQIEFLCVQYFENNMKKEEMPHSNSVLYKYEHIIDSVLCTERWLEVKTLSTKGEICAKHDVNVNASEVDCKIPGDSTDSPNSHTEGPELKSSSANVDQTHQSNHSSECESEVESEGKSEGKSEGDNQIELQKQRHIGVLLPSIGKYLDRDEQMHLELRHRKEAKELLEDLERCNKSEDEIRIAKAKLLNKQSKEMLDLVNYARKIFIKNEGSEPSNVYPVTAPPPQPPTLRHTDLYRDPIVFANVDKSATEVGKRHESFTDFVRKLVSKCNSDVEMVRAIFRWVDCNHGIINFDFYGPIIRGEKVYKIRPELFQLLCSYAGLHCKIIEGYRKTFLCLDIERNDNLKMFPCNVVFVANSWRYVNFIWIYWGYFLTDPQELIYDFFPLQKEWQLLEQPISFEDFAKQPKVDPDFFKFGLRFKNTNRVMYTDASGTTTVRIEIPAYVKSSLIFDYGLSIYINLFDSTYEKVFLNRFVMQSVVNNEVIFRVHAPCPDSFRLNVRAKKGENDFSKSICEIYIVCKEMLREPMPLPMCFYHEWGPNKATRFFGLVPISHQEAEVKTDGELKIQFRMTRPLDDFKATLRKNNIEEEQLTKFVSHKVTGDVVTFSIRFPTKGQYGLDIYTREPSKSYFEHCCQYLINY